MTLLICLTVLYTSGMNGIELRVIGVCMVPSLFGVPRLSLDGGLNRLHSGVPPSITLCEWYVRMNALVQ